jgi:hypothetical protein
MKGKWVVEVKGRPEEGHFEISIIRENNYQGKASWGWFGDNKLLVTHNGTGRIPMTKQIWDWQVAIANEVAEKLNAEEAEIDEHMATVIREAD